MTGPHTSLDFFEPNTKPGEVTGPLLIGDLLLKAYYAGRSAIN